MKAYIFEAFPGFMFVYRFYQPMEAMGTRQLQSCSRV